MIPDTGRAVYTYIKLRTCRQTPGPWAETLGGKRLAQADGSSVGEPFRSEHGESGRRLVVSVFTLAPSLIKLRVMDTSSLPHTGRQHGLTWRQR